MLFAVTFFVGVSVGAPKPAISFGTDRATAAFVTGGTRPSVSQPSSSSARRTPSDDWETPTTITGRASNDWETPVAGLLNALPFSKTSLTRSIDEIASLRDPADSGPHLQTAVVMPAISPRDASSSHLRRR